MPGAACILCVGAFIVFELLTYQLFDVAGILIGEFMLYVHLKIMNSFLLRWLLYSLSWLFNFVRLNVDW